MRHINKHMGFSLVEMLIAMSILAIVLSIVANGIVGTLKAQSINEELSTAQTKLRRITEVVSQDLRSAVLGGITNTPYTSGNNSISLSLLAGGAGYEVLPSAGDFRLATSTTILAPVATTAALALDNKQVMLVNTTGDASVFRAGNVTNAGNSQFTLPHAGCTNAIDYTNNTLLFGVTTLGYDFDSATGTLFQNIGGQQTPVAFDLTRFEVSYIYVSTTNSTVIAKLASPRSDAVTGVPLKQDTINGVLMQLDRLELVVSTDRKLYTSQIDLSSNASFFIRRVNSC